MTSLGSSTRLSVEGFMTGSRCCSQPSRTRQSLTVGQALLSPTKVRRARAILIPPAACSPRSTATLLAVLGEEARAGRRWRSLPAGHLHSGRLDKLPKGIKADKGAVAETIANNMRKVIVDKRAFNPKYYDTRVSEVRGRRRGGVAGATPRT